MEAGEGRDGWVGLRLQRQLLLQAGLAALALALLLLQAGLALLLLRARASCSRLAAKAQATGSSIAPLGWRWTTRATLS